MLICTCSLQKSVGIANKRKYEQSEESKQRRIAKLKETLQNKKKKQENSVTDKKSDEQEDHGEEFEDDDQEQAEAVCTYCKKKDNAKTHEDLVFCPILLGDNTVCAGASHRSCYKTRAAKKYKIPNNEYRLRLDPSILEDHDLCKECLEEFFTMKCCVTDCIDRKKASYRCLICTRPVHYSKNCSVHSTDGWVFCFI